MDLIERLISEAISVDFTSDSSALIGSDYEYNDETQKGEFFGTVCFELESTPILKAMIDSERKRSGFWQGKEDNYDFFMELNTLSTTHVAPRIIAIVKNESAPDYYANYKIELDEGCHRFIYETVDKQVQFTLKTTCEALLKKAEERAKEQNKHKVV